jgi:hypothetical protein
MSNAHELGKAPLQEVARAFFSERPSGVRLQHELGYPAGRLPTHPTPIVRRSNASGETMLLPLEEYESRTSYNPEQTAFIAAAKLRMHYLIKGKEYGSRKPIRSFPQLIVDAFLAQEEGEQSYGQAIKTAILHIYKTFISLHQNLTPALRGLFEINAAYGTTDVILHSANFLKAAKDGTLTMQTLNSFAVISDEEFSQGYIHENGMTGHEKFCAAPDIARGLKYLAALTAIQLEHRAPYRTLWLYHGEKQGMLPEREESARVIRREVLSAVTIPQE